MKLPWGNCAHACMLKSTPDKMHSWLCGTTTIMRCLQGSDACLLPVARSAADARVMLEALEAGTDGAVLQTEDPAQVVKPLQLTATHSLASAGVPVWQSQAGRQVAGVAQCCHRSAVTLCRHVLAGAGGGGVAGAEAGGWRAAAAVRSGHRDARGACWHGRQVRDPPSLPHRGCGFKGIFMRCEEP